MKKRPLPQTIACWLASILYVAAGIMHFVKPESYLKIIPPYIPWHVSMLRLTGLLEILGGLGLLLPRARRTAACGLIALLIAVFPANLYMATNPVEAGVAAIAPLLRWARLPMQALLILWLYWCGIRRSRL